MLAPKSNEQSRELLVGFFATKLIVNVLKHGVKLMSAAPNANEAGLCDVSEMCRNTRYMAGYFLLAARRHGDDDVPHNGYRTTRAFAIVSKITSAVCRSYMGTSWRCTLMMIRLLRCKRARMSRYDMLICKDMNKAIENVYASRSSSYTFRRLTARAIRTFLVIVKSQHAPVQTCSLRYLVESNTQTAWRKDSLTLRQSVPTENYKWFFKTTQ